MSNSLCDDLKKYLLYVNRDPPFGGFLQGQDALSHFGAGVARKCGELDVANALLFLAQKRGQFDVWDFDHPPGNLHVADSLDAVPFKVHANFGSRIAAEHQPHLFRRGPLDRGSVHGHEFVARSHPRVEGVSLEGRHHPNFGLHFFLFAVLATVLAAASSS
eukprot:CAMPEP_0113303238 /NCGR_PEP_ID=MMETSP0010_2-20120614/3739_1 /TAXON_ID=216773 ORGANISM="Corethron hystrix, Strain 308" /NCGR_SAMPLE_ID=MMETSP0010_2 /ASSEMBLY_ACC=CAM_ASM_000155 /LENGTH=160 /DNA_ID=CAMNT_0000157205 /DNA_START=596 /DNA_END=1076 /DNA_ORIENTATION=+ /assembly_acc=CAM_ASM_000155